MVDDKSCDNCAEETDNNGNCKPFLDGECVNINSGCPLAGRKWRERDFFKRLKDETTSNGALVRIVEAQSEVIKKQREEIAELERKIEGLKNSNKTITVGDFKIEAYVDGEQGEKSICIINGSEWKLINIAELWKSITRLYFSTEEKRSCETCGDKCNVHSFHATCQRNGFNKWTPKQS